MRKPAQMWDDERPIKTITTQGESYSIWTVGRTGVTRIVAYRENGQGASVPWLAIYEGDWLAHRVNAAAVESVWYGESPEGAADGARTVATVNEEKGQ
jgi:hypothetical protein